MKLKLKITRNTTNSELVHLGNFFTALGLNRGARVSADEPLTAPVDPAELDEPETVVVPTNDAHSSGAGFDKPKRSRRTKAQIEAEAHASQGEPLPEPETPAPTEPEQAPATETPAPTQPAPVTDTTPAQAPAEPEPATASHSEPPTPVSLNIKATAVAKKIGPEKIKAKIVELGGKLISTLSPEALIEFDAWLDAQ